MSRKTRVSLLAILGAAIVAAAACKGPAGHAGTDGTPGPTGPIAPATPPPVILDVAPPIASAASTIRLRVAGVGTAQPLVFFDGVPAASVAMTGTNEVWATGIPAQGGDFVEVSLAVNGQRSGSSTIARATAGTVRDLAADGISGNDRLIAEAGGTIAVLEPASGIYRFDPVTGILARRTTMPLVSPSLGVADGGDLLVMDDASHALLRVAESGAASSVVSNLPAASVGLARDASDGSIYWVDASGTIGRRAPDGAITASFATVPAASDMTALGGFLYVSDVAAGAIHRVAIPAGTVTAGWVSGLPGAGAITQDGTDLLVAATETAAHAVVRVTTAGVVSDAAPSHGTLVGAAGGIAASGGEIWLSSAVDGALESSPGVTAWELRAPSLLNESSSGLFAGERFFFASGRQRCADGDGGALAELLADGSIHTIATDACGFGTMAVDAPEAPLALYWADTRGDVVRRLDLADGSVADVVQDSAITAASGLGISPVDGSVFVGIPGGTPRVAHYDSGGGLLAASVSGTITADPTGIVATMSNLYVSTSDAVVRFDLGAGSTVTNPVTVAGAAQQLSGIVSLAPFDDGVVMATADGVFRLDAAAGLHFESGDPDFDGVGETPFHELLGLAGGNYPVAVLR